MVNEKKFQLTEQGIKQLEEELKERKTHKREEIIAALKEARAQGDLSENADYDAARDAQAENEKRIGEIEGILRNFEIIQDDMSDEVSIGKKVTFFNQQEKKEESFKIVGSLEADIFNGKISNESPIAQALIGKKVDDEVIISTPVGEMKVTITKIEHI